MDPVIRLRNEQSLNNDSINAILLNEEINDEGRAELKRLTERGMQIGVELRAAWLVEGETETRQLENHPDAEMRERLQLRGRASLTNFVMAAVSGRNLSGAEADLMAAAGISSGVPAEIFDTIERRASRQDVEVRVDVPSGVPGSGLGVNLDTVRPQVFANSVIPRLGVEMPRVMSGTYSTTTITGPVTAGAYLPGGEVMAAANTFAVGTAAPKRVSARMNIRIEDVAAVGQDNYESELRSNMSLALSAELDNQGLNGDGVAPNLAGLFNRLGTIPTPTDVVDFGLYAAAHASLIDGLWAMDLMDAMIVCGVATYQLAARTFQATAGSAGEVSAASYAAARTGGMWTNSRMPVPATNIQAAIGYRMGRSMMGGDGGMRTAVCPNWNQIEIDDIYSDAAIGGRSYTAHVLLGDVLLVQPAAYEVLAYQLA